MRRFLSLGAGVQSSALLLMADAGVFGGKPEAAVFADTQSEPPWVYEQVAYLETVCSIPILTVTAGDLGEDALSDRRFASMPVYTRGAEREGRLRRQCTKEYKIVPVSKAIRALVGKRPRQRMPQVEVWIGLSADEVVRAAPSKIGWQTYRWPLIEGLQRREDCVRWMEANGHPVPQKSSCVFCPFHSDAFWRDLRDNHPDQWARAVGFDAAVRGATRRGVEAEVFLHRSCRPLADVDLSTEEERGQGSLFEFAEECSGHCGV